jgi:hypothetical protein
VLKRIFGPDGQEVTEKCRKIRKDELSIYAFNLMEPLIMVE